MTRPLPPHTDEAHAAITAELVRLTLPHHPGSSRPALALPDPTVLARIRMKRGTRRRTTRRSR